MYAIKLCFYWSENHGFFKVWSRKLKKSGPLYFKVLISQLECVDTDNTFVCDLHSRGSGYR